MDLMTNQTVNILCGEKYLEGLLSVPNKPQGIIIFAHGSGSSRLSPRNQLVATILQQANFATLLFDLLTPEEDEVDEQTMEFRFDISFLSNRLLSATYWAMTQPALQFPMGYFGASTGAAAALIASVQVKSIQAIVSRGGRPDLAGDHLKRVEAATLLLVGGNDEEVITLNEQALTELTGEKKLTIIPQASHLFEEAGALEAVAKAATQWFQTHLR
jgi:putative phosphoribosyl transferase